MSLRACIALAAALFSQLAPSPGIASDSQNLELKKPLPRTVHLPSGKPHGYKHGFAFSNGWEMGWSNDRSNEWSKALSNGRGNGWQNGWSNGWSNGWTNGWTNGWRNGWTNGWTNGTDPGQHVYVDGGKYLTRPRNEDGRLMMDMCRKDTSHCPDDLNAAGQCCHRTMVLRGVFWAETSTGMQGRWIRWKPTVTVHDRSGKSGTVDSTLVPDPCYTKAGATTCLQSHFWDLAGPGGPAYPDCIPAIGIACNGPHPSDLIDPGIESTPNTPVRALLATAASGLITTNGSFIIDLRWLVRKDASQVLVPDPAFKQSQLEAKWDWEPTAPGGLVSKPRCYAHNAPQRTSCSSSTDPSCDPNLVKNVPSCTGQNKGRIGTYWK